MKNKKKYKRYAEIMRLVLVQFKVDGMFICWTLDNIYERGSISANELQNLTDWIDKQLGEHNSYGGWLNDNGSTLYSYNNKIEGRVQWIEAMIAQLDVWATE